MEKINSLKEFYQGKIEVKCGLEIGTRPSPSDLSVTLANKLDFCLKGDILRICVTLY